MNLLMNIHMTREQYIQIEGLTSLLMLALDSNTLNGTKNNPLQVNINHLKSLCDSVQFERICRMLNGFGFQFN